MTRKHADDMKTATFALVSFPHFRSFSDYFKRGDRVMTSLGLGSVTHTDPISITLDDDRQPT